MVNRHERRIRQIRREQAEPAKSGPGENRRSPVYTRREVLGPLALLLAGGGIYATHRHFRNQSERQLHMESLPINFDEVVERLKSEGKIVFDEENGLPERMFVLLKQFHGDSGFADLLAKHPDLLQKYMDHQDSFTNSVKSEMTNNEPGLVHALVEGPDLAGRRTTWRSDSVESLRLLGDPRMTQAIRDDVPSELQKGGMTAFKAMASCMAAVNIAAFSTANPKYTNYVHGSDPRNFRGVAHEMYDRIETMARKTNVTDAEVKSFIKWFINGDESDMKRRNEYATSEALDLTPRFGVTFIILGGGHMAAGAYSKNDGACPYPLEEMLSKSKGTRTVVLDQQHFEYLMNYRGEGEQELYVVGKKNINVDIVRELIRRKRELVIQKSS